MTEQQPLLPSSTGEMLRAARLRRGLALRAVAEQLRCPIALLEQLESDTPVHMPAVYLRGHLKRYAGLLELEDEVTEQLLAEHTRDEPGVQTIYETRPRIQASDRWLRVASYALASLLVGTLAWQVTHEAVRLTAVNSIDPDSAAATVGARDASPVDGATHVNASIAALESLPASSLPRLGDAGAVGWRALESARQAEPPLMDGAHRLVVETSADSWVEIIEGDGQLLEQDLLRGGERRQYQGQGPFSISLGRSSAVRLSLDGQGVDLQPYTRDDVARLLLDPATANDPAVEPAGIAGSADQQPARAPIIPMDGS